jgi:phosphonate transport system substrate-binding protein
MLRRTALTALLLPLLSWAAPPNPAAAASTPLRIGVAPHSSARVILEMYQPLRQHLETALQRPVEVVTAPDFTEFARRALAQQYDVAITTGHQARLFQSDAGYLPLLTYKADFKAVTVVAADSRFREPRDLAGATIIGLSRSSLVTLWGEHWVFRNNLPGTTMRYVSASDSVGQLILRGEGAAGFMSLANYQSLPPAARGQLRVLSESVAMTGRTYLLNGRHAALRERLMGALWAFAETAEAKAYFARYKLDGYRALEPRELLAMEPYAAEVRQELRQGR